MGSIPDPMVIATHSDWKVSGGFPVLLVHSVIEQRLLGDKIA